MDGKSATAALPPEASTTRARVLYADTDRMDVVYHATYLRWFEAGRAHYMRRRGVSYVSVTASGVELPVIEAHIEFIRPARYDDVLDVHAWIAEMGGAQLRFEYLITRDGEELVRGYTRHAALGSHGRPTRLPREVRGALTGEETAAGDRLDD